jgi:putative membrane-bound dehydrogenase-like protein
MQVWRKILWPAFGDFLTGPAIVWIIDKCVRFLSTPRLYARVGATPLMFDATRSLVSLVAISVAFASHVAEPAGFELDHRLTLSLFAKEPDVVDPVALTWDADGRMYVVEMRDYPYGFGPDRKPGGTIRLLEDTNDDGMADRSTLFATDLSFPTSIAPWNGGIIVAAPPEIIFLKDTDGDGKADEREVLLKGFVLGVTDSNMNGLRWGLDNRLHGVNGGNGGEVTSTRKPGPPLSLRNLDFSFDPQTGDVTSTFHTSGGFGLVFDDWGRSFVTYNINHIQQRMIPARYLSRFRGFPPVQGVEGISDHGDMARIFPVSEPETRVNHPEQSGHFSSAGGMGLINSRAFPEDLHGSVLVCDVVGNLVHRDVLAWNGPVWVASRAAGEKEREFLASRDRASRPIGLEFGPDGALYLVDMQRDVIEHPDYIPQPVRDKLDLRAGETRGRIYRIVPKGGLTARQPRLGRATGPELVEYLNHSNAWQRTTAQRLLMEGRARAGWTNEITPRLRTLAQSASPLGRLHTLWTLQGFGALDEATLRRALDDSEPGIRENALLLAESRLAQSKELQRQIMAMASDPDARVRFQTALTLGAADAETAIGALTKILARDLEHRWSRLAVLSSLAGHEQEALHAIAREARNSDAKVAAVRELADLAGARCRKGEGDAVARFLNGITRFPAKLQVAALEGFESGVARSGVGNVTNAPLVQAIGKLSELPATLPASWRLARTLGIPASEAQMTALKKAIKIALDDSRSLGERTDAIGLIALGEFPAIRETLFALLEGRQPTAVQLAAIDALRPVDHTDVARELVDRWRALAPATRSPVINLLLQRLTFHGVLIDALERGALTIGELNLDLEQRRRLLWESTPELKARATKLMGDGEYANRKGLVDEWLKRLPAAGDSTGGRAVFERTCAQCHALAGVGHAVGPDLAALAHRSVEDLVSNILDPNMAINPAYAGYTVETTAGEIESGILQSETGEAIQLLQALGRKVVVPRAKIKRLHSSGLSLMPEGLEAGLTPADLRDLIAFLQMKR